MGTTPTKPYYGGKKTKDSVAQVVQYLKERYKAEQAARREGQLLLAMSFAEREQNRNHTVPTRKPIVTKLNTFNTTLAKCPGGARDEAKTGAHTAYLKQISHPETGCVVVHPDTNKGQATLRRLANSARNANTTQGNYNSTVRR